MRVITNIEFQYHTNKDWQKSVRSTPGKNKTVEPGLLLVKTCKYITVEQNGRRLR